jgi:hypothetical protein
LVDGNHLLVDGRKDVLEALASGFEPTQPCGYLLFIKLDGGVIEHNLLIQLLLPLLFFPLLFELSVPFPVLIVNYRSNRVSY